MSESFIPERKNRKEMVKLANDASRNLAEGGREELLSSFEFVDSTLESPNDFASFQKAFESLVPEGTGSLRSYIERTLEKQKGHAVGIEFGGPGSQLFEGFTPLYFNKSIGVTLAEHRLPQEIMDLETHTVLEGDIRKEETYDAVRKELAGRKADLIFERLRGGWHYIQKDPVLFGKILSEWYELLNEGGLIIAEAPYQPGVDHHQVDFHQLLKRWKESIDQNEAGKIEVTVPDSVTDFGTAVFSVHKLEGAPEKLPLLPIRELIRPSSP